MNDNVKSFLSELLETMIFSLAFYAVAELMVNPGLRQRVAMAFYREGKKVAQWQADAWQECAISFAQAYNKARL